MLELFKRALYNKGAQKGPKRGQKVPKMANGPKGSKSVQQR